MAGEKQLVTVIRGLPSDFDVDEIIQELGTHNITSRARFGHEKPQTEQEHAFVFGSSRKCPANFANFPSYIHRRQVQVRELRNFLCDEDPDIIGIQETHLGPADSFKLPNYICHRSDRLSHREVVRPFLSETHSGITLSLLIQAHLKTLLLDRARKTTLTSRCRAFTSLRGIILTRRSLMLFSTPVPRSCFLVILMLTHPCWNPGRPNTHGNTLQLGEHPCPEIMAPTAPTYYAARGTCSILDIAFAKNLILEDINSVNDLSSDHNPVLIDLALNNSLPKISVPSSLLIGLNFKK
ncbi:RNA-directed DNA polymerase from mobile element jockey [Trichonephila clavipes]|nr:RNA-directed DNA polymerase from mobile element jockey [Trichonephila clavipes]